MALDVLSCRHLVEEELELQGAHQSPHDKSGVTGGYRSALLDRRSARQGLVGSVDGKWLEDKQDWVALLVHHIVLPAQVTGTPKCEREILIFEQ
jgi:hypothetical protein